MPPHLDPPPRPELPAERVVDIPPDVIALASFFGTEGYGAALLATGYTRKDLTESLIAIARSTVAKTAEKLKAMQMLHDMGVELMEINGVIGRQKEQNVTRNQDGTLTVHLAEARTLNRLLQSAQQAAPRSLHGVIIHDPHQAAGASPHPQGHPPGAQPQPPHSAGPDSTLRL